MIGDGGENDKSEGGEVGRSQIDQDEFTSPSSEALCLFLVPRRESRPGGIEMRETESRRDSAFSFHGCLAYKSYKVQNDQMGIFFSSLINI